MGDSLFLNFDDYAGKIAVIYRNKEYSYDDMKYIQNRYAKMLNAEVIRTPVLIMMDRSPELIAAMWTAINLNLTYILVDVEMPDERIAYILADTKAEVIITEEKYIHRFEGKHVICLTDQMDEEIISALDSVNECTNHLAYILYTSGSSGLPKGVKITRDNLIHFIEGVPEIIDFSEGKKIASFTSISFDIFFLESILSLKSGMTIVLADEAEKKNSRLMGRLITDHQVDMVQLTPSAMQMMLNYDDSLLSFHSVKELMIGGEQFPEKLLHTIQKKLKTKIFNMYGPTETTVWVTISDLTDKESVDVGRPMKDVGIHILDQDLEEKIQGEEGEICISGGFLGEGYVNREELTKERFVTLPKKQIRVYKTGDYGKIGEDGNLFCLGRMDNQIKIRGHRIEIEEIENVIQTVEGISQAMVTVRETGGQKELIAFYTVTKPIADESIVEVLKQKLPVYMIPAKYYQAESFSYTINGKIDRKESYKRLTYLEEIAPSVSEGIEEDIIFDQGIFERLKDIIRSITESGGTTIIRGNSKLLQLGIDSLLFMTLLVMIEDEFEIVFDNDKMNIGNFNTINDMIEYIYQKING